jgi:hypothetical protein
MKCIYDKYCFLLMLFSGTISHFGLISTVHNICRVFLLWSKCYLFSISNVSGYKCDNRILVLFAYIYYQDIFLRKRCNDIKFKNWGEIYIYLTYLNIYIFNNYE